MTPRRRLRFDNWPAPHIAWTDTPDPRCDTCDGTGQVDVPDSDYESASRELCHCWWPNDTRRVLSVPAWAARLLFGWQPPAYSDEAPF